MKKFALIFAVVLGLFATSCSSEDKCCDGEDKECCHGDEKCEGHDDAECCHSKDSTNAVAPTEEENSEEESTEEVEEEMEEEVAE